MTFLCKLPDFQVILVTLCVYFRHQDTCLFTYTLYKQSFSKANFHRTTWSPITELLSAHQCSLVKASSRVYKLAGSDMVFSLQVFDSGSVCAVVAPMHIFQYFKRLFLMYRALFYSSNNFLFTEKRNTYNVASYNVPVQM